MTICLFIRSVNISFFVLGTYAELILFFIKTTKIIIKMTNLEWVLFAKICRSFSLFCMRWISCVVYVGTFWESQIFSLH